MKKVIILVLVLILAIIVALVILGINYFNCLSEEGNPCTAAAGRTSSVSTTFNPVYPSSGLKYKCNFFTGKTCK